MFALSRMKKAVALREKYFSRIQTAFDLIKEIEDSEKAALFITRVERIDEDLSSFESAQDTIVTTNLEVEEAERVTDTTAMSKSCDELYFAIKVAAKGLLEREYIRKGNNKETRDLASNESVLQPSMRYKIKLPRIDIPQFAGDLQEWTNFHTLFETLVHHNSELSGAEKFHYLRGSLKGPALRLIESLHISEGNYQIAYDTLLTRYNSKRRLANLYIERITSVKPMNEESVEGLQKLTEIFATDVLALQTLGVKDLGDLFLLHFGLKGLDAENRKRFEDKCSGQAMPTFKTFVEFVNERRNILEIVAANKISGARQRPKQVLCAQGESKNPSCALCQGEHRLSECPALLQRTPKERYDVLKERLKGICFNCFAVGHISRFCRSKARCNVCQKKHHGILHSTEIQATSKSEVQANQSERGSSQEVLSTSAADSNALLGTARALIKDRTGHLHPLRLVIDCGAQRSFITSSLAENLRLKMSPNPHGLRGFGGAPIAGGQRQAKCILLPKTGAQIEVCMEAVVIPRICSRIPSQRLPRFTIDSFQGIALADESFYEPGEIDFLLGADRFLEIFSGVSSRKVEGTPNVMETIFGAVVIGPTPCDTEDSVVSLLASSSIEDLPQIMEKFWKVEEVAEIHPINPLDIMCEEHFRKTHSREKDGRYRVRLPFKDTITALGPSKPLALLRFYRLEDKFRKNKELKLLYDQTIREYLELGFISRTDTEGTFYLPHHGVLKEGATTKLRIVFDASASTKTGSLNDRLLIGPKLQLDIKDVLLGFRTYRVALTSDICKMFLQVVVDEEDRKFQHFLYRFDKSKPLEEYRFNRVSFGMSCSPYIALRVIRQLIEDEGVSYPLASKALKRDTYVDDILTGADSTEEAEQLRIELIELLKRGGFSLKSWNSNDRRIMQEGEGNVVEEVSAEKQAVYLGDMEDKAVKVLGMQWEPEDDVLTYKVQSRELIATKRGIMSTIARMYDPLGYLAPVVFKAKVVLQKLWRSKLDWDDPLPRSVTSEWREYYEELPNIEAVTISRCFFSKSPSAVDVVGFADASSDGYAAVLYLRIVDCDGNVSSHLTLAKTKLAPLKSLTIPRLELCAAQLLVKMLKTSEEFLQRFEIRSTYLLSDSKTVLAWMKTPLYKLHTFVTNRVHWILDRSEADSWYYVPTHHNAADVASRGIAPRKLVDLDMWWKGPSWLKEDRSEWPITQVNVPEDELPELKRDVLLNAFQDSDDRISALIERQSSYLRLVRAFAYVRRFIARLKGKGGHLDGKELLLTEIKASTSELVKFIQRKHFDLSVEPKCWKEFRALSPFLDTQGIVRVGGRLANAPVNDRLRHPILLPTKSHFTKILVDYYHRCHLHAGPQLLLSLLRQTYWIPSARRTIRARFHQCIVCRRAAAKPFTPLMGNLPEERFNQERPFVHVGTDFAGPFMIRESRRRKAPLSKAYVCIFICLSVKAVHLEIVSQLSTEAFLACLDRFIARRGLPKVMFSDNGTNFVGANRQLKELFQWWNTDDLQEEIRKFSTSKEIVWKFSPPSAPHFGGIWEAGVKSLKYHFTRVVGSQNLTFEEMNTVVARIEAILNSRPLHPLGSDPEDLEALTPGHFLIGMPLVARIEEDVTELPDNRLSHWQRVQAFVQRIWRRWRQDYLHELQQRKKWWKDPTNVEVGTMVIVKTENTPPLEWPIGRIIECYKGGDNVIRVVKVKTAKGELVRPLVKLAPLLPRDDASSSG